MQSPSAEDETAIFEQSFSQAAEGMLLNKIPEVAESILTFKIIKSDIDSGSAIGAFILQLGQDVIYVPVVLIENQLKPMEAMFVKSTGSFLPFNNEWLQEVSRDQMDPLGEGVPRPATLTDNVDMSGIVRPPESGRFSYAAAKGLHLPGFLDKAGNTARTKLAQVVSADPDLLRSAIAIYGKDTLMSMLAPRQEKTAAKRDVPQARVLTRKSTAAEIRSLFGKEAAVAMQQIARDGYVVLDTRKTASEAVTMDSPIRLHEATTGGVYRLLKTDGKVIEALVAAAPAPLCHHKHFSSDRKEVLVLTPDGECALITKPPTGDPVLDLDKSKFSTHLSGKATQPKRGWGVFVRRDGTRIQATKPVFVTSVVTDAEGARRVLFSKHESFEGSEGHDVLITDPKRKFTKIHHPEGTNVFYLPEDFSFVSSCNPWSSDLDKQIVTSHSAASSIINSSLLKTGGEILKVARRGSTTYHTSHDRGDRSKLATLLTLILKHNLREKTAKAIMDAVDAKGSHSVLLVSATQQVKLAMGEAMPPSAGGEQPGAAMDPAMGQAMDGQLPPGGAPPGMMPPGGDPSMMGAPPMPSPLDQAIQEVKDKLTEVSMQQQQALSAQMESLQQQLAALETVGVRTQEVAQGIPKEESPSLQQNPGINPELMQESQAVQDPSVFDSSAIASLADSATMTEAVSMYIPTLMRALDHLGRILVTLWMKGPELKQELGEEKYNTLEDKMRNIFRGMGELMLRMNQQTQIIRQGDEFNNEVVNGS